MLVRFVALLAVLAAPSAAQTALTVSSRFASDLGPDDAHAYTVDLPPNTFVAGRADEETVDLVVTVTGPDGDVLVVFGDPARGAEPFQFETRAPGTHTITVAPVGGSGGRYALVVDRVEPVAATPRGRVRQRMAAWDRADVPGAAVAIVRDGEIAYAEAFGTANLTHGVPFSLGTRIHLGSTSKQFTAFAVGLLAAQGALGLDDDVREHLPELPDFGETVTLRDLLTDQSGYREYRDALVIAGRPVPHAAAVDRAEVVRIVQRQPDLQNASDAEGAHGETNYALLAEVVARVTGEPFPDWMAANVFVPLGMNDTVVRASPTQIVPGSAQGYIPDGVAWREAADPGRPLGAAGIYSTVGDLARWMAHLVEPIYAPAVVAEMTAHRVSAGGDAAGYGPGLVADRMGRQPHVWHSGGSAAHRSAFSIFPDLNAGVIVLTNAPARTGEMIRLVAWTFFDGAFTPGSPTAVPASRSREIAVVPPPARPDFEARPPALAAFTGRFFSTEVDAAYAFAVANGVLVSRNTRDGDTPLRHVQGDQFTLGPVTLTFERDPAGNVIGFTADYGRTRDVLFERID